MVLTGLDIDGKYFTPPINTHVSHAFYLNCRKLADFFQNRKQTEDVKAEHFVPGYEARLPVFSRWRTRIDQQLAHVTYKRDIRSRELKSRTQDLLYKELRTAWRGFRQRLPKLYGDQFVKKVKQKKAPNRKGVPSGFRSYDLD
jgi:hypothetical protein